MSETLSGRQVALFGGGGHAAAVADVIERLGGETALVVSPDPPSLIDVTHEIDDGAGMSVARDAGLAVVVAIGHNGRRHALVQRLAGAGLVVARVIARSATVALDAVLGPGTVVMEHAHVGPASRLGTGVLVNSGAIVEHHSVLGDACHVGPGAVVAGAALVGARTLVGVSASVLPGIRVGSDAVVAAGAVVTRDVPDGHLARGTPARIAPQDRRGHEDR